MKHTKQIKTMWAIVAGVVLSFSPSSVQANNLFGIDVSSYQGSVNWSSVHANGAVASSREGKGLQDQPALPGDVIFVPVKSSIDTLERIREISTVVYQLGVGIATIGIGLYVAHVLENGGWLPQFMKDHFKLNG